MQTIFAGERPRSPEESVRSLKYSIDIVTTREAMPQCPAADEPRSITLRESSVALMYGERRHGEAGGSEAGAAEGRRAQPEGRSGSEGRRVAEGRSGSSPQEPYLLRNVELAASKWSAMQGAPLAGSAAQSAGSR